MSAPLQLSLLRDCVQEFKVELEEKLHSLELPILAAKAKGEKTLSISSVLDSIEHQRAIMHRFQVKLSSFFSNPFETIPDEMIISIFSHITSFQDLAHLSSVCKSFGQLLEQESLWKKACNSFWTTENIHRTIHLDLDMIVEEIKKINQSKGWRWFAECFFGGKRNHLEGLSFRVASDYDCYSTLAVGFHVKGKLEGWGLKINTEVDCETEVDAGNFTAGEINGEGVTFWNGGRYEGTFKNDNQDGKGVYVTPSGKFKGEWKEGDKSGYGTFTWHNGFTYSGEWENDQPTDPVACLHPSIRKCIEEKQCTSSVTGLEENYGQFLYYSPMNNFYYCVSCHNNCNQLPEENWEREWNDSAFCDCAEQENQCALDLRPKKKQKRG